MERKKSYSNLDKYIEKYQITESSALWGVLKKDYPNVFKKVSQISKEMNWEIDGAYSFCLQLLQDVNAHSVAERCAKIFDEDLKRNKRNKQ